MTAYAVTATLREWYADGDAEELEYAATLAAARASLRLLADDGGAPRRRVVIAADVADSDVKPVPDVERASVLITSAVPMSKVASGHVDDEAVADVIAAAASVVRQADAGDDDAEFSVDEAQAQDLQWFATQELSDLVQ